MELWINNIKKGKNVDFILGIQLKRAMSSFDIYLETEEPLSPNSEFQPDKTFLKAYRGRNRSRPFKVIQNPGSTIYTQI